MVSTKAAVGLVFLGFFLLLLVIGIVFWVLSFAKIEGTITYDTSDIEITTANYIVKARS